MLIYFSFCVSTFPIINGVLLNPIFLPLDRICMLLQLQIKVTILQFGFLTGTVCSESSHLYSMPMAKTLHEDLFLWKCQAPANLHMTGNLLMGIACRSAKSVNIAIAH